MKTELTPAEYALREGITINAVYMRVKAGTVEYRKVGMTHWKKSKYVILVD